LLRTAPERAAAYFQRLFKAHEPVFLQSLRLIASILMILVLFLAGQPVCSAASGEQAAAHCCQSENGSCEDDDDHGNSCSSCNPFQTCACCVAGIVAPASIGLKIACRVGLPERTQDSPVTQMRLSSFRSGVWQPPRQI
jgi:hypothetical protein